MNGYESIKTPVDPEPPGPGVAPPPAPPPPEPVLGTAFSPQIVTPVPWRAIAPLPPTITPPADPPDPPIDPYGPK